MKRVYRKVFAGCLAASMLAAPVSALEFADVQGHWGQQAIEQVSDWGIFSGTGENQFSPDVTVTRGMFVTVLAQSARKLNVYQEMVGGQAAFSDVPADAYYAPYVAWAYEHGLVAGVDAAHFQPEAEMTREQMCAVTVKFLEKFSNQDLTAHGMQENTFLDRDAIQDYAKKSVNLCVELGLFAGVPADGGVKFQPTHPASRAAVAVVMQKMLNQMEKWQTAVPEQPEEERPSGGASGSSGGGGGGGGGSSAEDQPDREYTEEEIAEEATVAEALSNMVHNYETSDYVSKTSQEAQDCMKILMDCIKDALVQRENGQFLTKKYIRSQYASEISELKKKYKELDEFQLGDVNAIIVRLEETENIYTVMDYFGVSI